MPVTSSLYFPNTLKVRVGFKPRRIWNTEVVSSPTGQSQEAPNWLRPKRTLRATILGYDDATFQQIESFLYQTMGRYLPFYVFNWRKKTFVKDPPEGVPVLLGNPSQLPLVLPYLFTGATVGNVYRNGTLTWGPGNFTVDGSGPGGEVRLATVTGGPTLLVGDLIQVDIINARERILVKSTVDADDFDHDWTAAEPPTETNLDLIEYW